MVGGAPFELAGMSVVGYSFARAQGVVDYETTGKWIGMSSWHVACL